MRIVFLGLSVTSSWGNGHATTYRALLSALHRQGHDLLFLERDQPWYARHRDAPALEGCRVRIYDGLTDLKVRFTREVRSADCVIVGSYVPDGIEVGEWVLGCAAGVVAFYDIDTPVTLAALRAGTCRYLSPSLVKRYPLYLSFSGGPALEVLRDRHGAPDPRAFHCSADPSQYYPEPLTRRWDLGYLGTYSPDRQAMLEELMLDPAREAPHERFVVAGPQYPAKLCWPSNVERIEHLGPPLHRSFYNAQRFTLNVTRKDMTRLGYSPSVRLFEAAACGVPIISDRWDGLETFFEVGSEILVADSAAEVLRILKELPEEERVAIGRRARERVLKEHTAAHRAAELELFIQELANSVSKETVYL